MRKLHLVCILVASLFVLRISAISVISQMVDIGDGIKIYTETSGNVTSGQVMVFIHGSGGNTEIWSGVRDYYKRSYPTVAVDLRGHRYSSSPKNSSYSFNMWADDVHEVLTVLGVKEIICFGGNFGTNVCWRLERLHNDTIPTRRAIYSGGNPLTVATTKEPSLTPNATNWEYSEISTALHGQICGLMFLRKIDPNHPAWRGFLQATCAGVFSDQCSDMEGLCQHFIYDGSNSEDPDLMRQKFGCNNPEAWPFNTDFDTLDILRAAKYTPRLIIVGSENLPFSRGYSAYNFKKLLPIDSVRPNGQSSPQLAMPPGRSVYMYATDVKGFVEEVDKFLNYGPGAAKKCDPVWK